MQRDLIEKWIKNRKPGEVFTIKDLPHGISRDMGDKMLSLMVKDGRIRRAARGIYYIPQWSQLLKKEVGVDVGKIAYAIARKFDWEIRPSDEYAVNLMGLSTQIPAHYVYVTTGPSKKYQIDGSTLTFVHRCNREMMLACPDARDVARPFQRMADAALDGRIVVVTVNLQRPVGDDDIVVKSQDRIVVHDEVATRIKRHRRTDVGR